MVTMTIKGRERTEKGKTAQDVTIRPLLWADFEDIVKNYYSFHDELEINPDLGLSMDGQRPTMDEEVSWFGTLYSEVLRRKAVVFVAASGGRVVGVCEVRGSARSALAHVGTLGIAIVRDYRGMGIGRKLVTGVVGAASELFDVIVLDVFTVNAGARHLYSSLGFRSMGILPMAVKRNGKYYDEERMYLLCKTPPDNRH